MQEERQDEDQKCHVCDITRDDRVSLFLPSYMNFSTYQWVTGVHIYQLHLGYISLPKRYQNSDALQDKKIYLQKYYEKTERKIAKLHIRRTQID